MTTPKQFSAKAWVYHIKQTSLNPQRIPVQVNLNEAGLFFEGVNGAMVFEMPLADIKKVNVQPIGWPIYGSSVTIQIFYGKNRWNIYFYNPTYGSHASSKKTLEDNDTGDQTNATALDFFEVLRTLGVKTIGTPTNNYASAATDKILLAITAVLCIIFVAIVYFAQRSAY